MIINIYLSTTCLSGGTFILMEYATRLMERGHDVVCYFNAMPTKFEEGTLHGKFRNSILGRNLRCLKAMNRGAREIVELRQRYPNVKICTVCGLDSHVVRAADAGLAGSWQAAYMLSDDYKTCNKLYLVQGYEDWDSEGHGRESYHLHVPKAVISNGINSMLKEKLNIGPFPVIYNGIDLGIYQSNNRSFSRNPNSIICSMLYSNSNRKGCDIGLYAYREIHRKYPGLKLIMFGIPKCPSLEFEVEYHQVASQAETVDIYRRSDIFIWPSIWEGWGLTAIEAMACQCVVVGSDTASMHEIGIDGVNALLSAPNDKKALLENLERVVENNALRKNLGINARKSVEKLSWEISVTQVEKELMKE